METETTTYTDANVSDGGSVANASQVSNASAATPTDEDRSPQCAPENKSRKRSRQHTDSVLSASSDCAAPNAGQPKVRHTSKHDNVFQQQVSANMRIQPSSVPNIGLGAFWGGSHPLPARRRIGVYAGRLLPKQPSDCTYVFELSSRRYVCARSKRYSNWTRYINDPRPDLKANVCFTSDGRVSTLRRIQPGEELFVDYGDWYFL
jgi:hypothetical protein